jgi:hypothetical protein
MSKQLSHKPQYQKARGLAQSAFAFAADPPLAARFSNDVIGFEGAEDALVHFHLNCRVANAKMLVQIERKPYEKFITGMTARHQTMTAQGRLGRADRPDVQIVNSGHPWLSLEKAADLLRRDPDRHRV